MGAQAMRSMLPDRAAVGGGTPNDFGVSSALASAGYGQREASAPSPYERYYWEDVAARRGIEAGREVEATRLSGEAERWLSPQAWASAGPDASYWKGEAARQLSQATQAYNGTVANIEWRFQNNRINEAQRRIELDRAKRDLAAKRAAAQNAVQQQRVQTGMQAAQEAATGYSKLAGQVPRDYAQIREPERIGLETTGVDVGGRGGGAAGVTGQLSHLAQDLRKAGYSHWSQVPNDVRNRYAARYPALAGNAKMRKENAFGHAI